MLNHGTNSSQICNKINEKFKYCPMNVYNIGEVAAMNKKVDRRNRLAQKKIKTKSKQYFDQEEENMDMLQMEQNHDPQYNQLLKSHSSANFKKNAYFFNSQRYNTSKQPAQQSDLQSQQQQEQQQADQQPNQIANALKQIRQQRKKKSQLLTEDIQKIDQQDQEFEILRKKQKTSEETLEQSLHLKNQLQLYKDLVDVRYNKQNQLEAIKRFPHRNFIKDSTLNSQHKQLETNLFQNLNQLIDLYNTYANKVFHTSQTNEISQLYHSQIETGTVPQTSLLNVSDIYKHFIAGHQSLVKQTERELVKWSQKTNLINVSSSHYSSLLMQTPIGQTKKVLANWDRVCSKSQTKRSTFKVLFEDDQNIRLTSDKQIFDDLDLFNELQKVYVSQIEDDNDFRINDTLQYLKNRQARAQKTKQVDRKASKNRKIRFNVHAKLLNFMPSKPEVLIEARDQIVSNIFNCRSTQQAPSKPEEGETYYIDM